MQTENTEIKPNLFIVGSMKCGTTILYDFLCRDKRIVGADGKEIHYFSLFREKGDFWYESHFETHPSAEYLLDASPTYLDMANNDDIPEAIRAYSPDAKIIIMIRDPIDRAISHLTHYKKVNKLELFEHTEFSDLLPMFKPDTEGNALKPNASRHIRDFSFYFEKIERYVRIFGSTNVMVVHNNDLRSHGDVIMDSIYEFLGLNRPDEHDYKEQRYVTGTNRDKLTLSAKVELYSLYGSDYYSSCRAIGIRRPLSEDSSIELNEPTGAILNDVGFGADGFLFLVGGTNKPLGMFEASDSERNAIVDAWSEVIKKRNQKITALGATYFQMMIPEKISILGDKLGWGLNTRNSYGSLLNNRFYGDTVNPTIDIFNMFRSSPHRDKLYYKTDSHWSHLGAFAAYQMICKRMNIPFEAELLKREFKAGPTLFDLGAKLPWPVKEPARYYRFRKNARIAEEGELVAFKKKNDCENEAGLHVGSFIRFQYDNAPRPEKVLIFGDSFCEYRDHLLTGLFADTFSEVSFAWTTSIDYGLVKELKPDVVLCAMTERFMSQIPNDDFDLRAFSAKRVQVTQGAYS